MPEVNGRLDREPTDNAYYRTIAAVIRLFPSMLVMW